VSVPVSPTTKAKRYSLFEATPSDGAGTAFARVR
jgi:hypothetical protein